MGENYKIEGNIDFNSELLKAICDESDEETDEPMCLITYQKLTEHHIKLSCNHSFCVECIDKWLTINKKCPLCNKEVQVINNK